MISVLCDYANVTRSGYHAWNARLKGVAEEDFIEEWIINIFQKFKAKRGARSIKMLLSREFSAIVNLKKIRRIMIKHRLETKIRRKNAYRAVFKLGEEHSVLPNLVNRSFAQIMPDQVYSTDITYLHYGTGEMAYLSASKDLGTNEIIHFNVLNRMNLDLVTNGLAAFFDGLPLDKISNLILHSDQGGHYTSKVYRSLLSRHGVKQSMSRKGNCLDNAPIESFFGHLKDEIELKDCKAFAEVVTRVSEYIDYYNNERPQWVLKGKTPAECRGFLEAPFY